MNRPTRLQHALDDLVAEIRGGFEPAPERISTAIPQRLLTDWVWSPSRRHICGRAGWTTVTGEVLAVDPGQNWAVAADAFYWLQREDSRAAFRSLLELPRPDVDVGSVADLTDAEMAMMRRSRTPAEHDHHYDEGPVLTEAVEILLQRLQTGWQPKADEIDIAVTQHDLIDWHWFEPSGERDWLLLYSARHDADPSLTGDIIWIDKHLGWALSTEAFWWLYDAEEGWKLDHLGG